MRGLLVVVMVLACEKSPPEIIGKDPKGGGSPNSSCALPAQGPAEEVNGPVDLKTATMCMPAAGQLYADLETDQGKLTCKLLEDKAPIAVANFVALARGIQPFRDPGTGTWVRRPAYDGTRFHRIIKGFMSQGGDPTGSGGGDPGYTFKDELWGGKHDKPGLLCMANKGPNTNGMQFFITDAAAAWLDQSYTIFGECTPEAVVHKLASVPVSKETPINKPLLARVTIRRQ